MACLFFFLAGLAFLTKIGIENDEALFGGTFLKPYGGAYTIQVGHSRIPLMVMTYIGTLKAWLYRPLMKIFGTGLVILRLPMLLAGVASIWLFYRLLLRMAGKRTATIGCILLAVDSTYLLTIVFDWGPVALQHLLLISGMLLLVGFYQEKSPKTLFWGFCMLGLALWDKALAVWMLSGMGVAIFAVMPMRLLALFTRRRLAIAALGFLLGALPLLVYNVENHWATFVGNVVRDTSDMPGKARMLRETAKGGGLFGWMFDEQWQTPAPHPPAGIVQAASAKISSLAGHPRRHLLLYAFVLAVLLLPVLRGDALRAVLFGILAMVIAWLQMATNANTGGSVHHTILLWPLPELVVAVAFAAASRRLGRAGRPVAIVVTAAMALAGVLVTNEYYFVSYSYGPTPLWSDAVLPLTDYVKGVRSGNVYCVDWGMLDSIRYLSHGTVKVAEGTDPISKPQLSPEDRLAALRMVGEAGAVFVAHTKDFENFQGTNERLLKFAANEGYQQEMMKVVDDSFGRPAFEVYRFVKTE